MSNKLHLARLAIVITTRCNLKCKLCSVGIPTQNEPYHMELTDFKTSVDKIFNVIDTVGSLEIGGGEPLLHSCLPQMIEKYMEYKERFEQWLLVTNGTVPLSKDLIDVLSKHKQYGVLHISDYNIYPEKIPIEGSELEALKCAKRIICDFKPKLAIAAYHKPEDIYTILELIREYRNDYKFYLNP